MRSVTLPVVNVLYENGRLSEESVWYCCLVLMG